MTPVLHRLVKLNETSYSILHDSRSDPRVPDLTPEFPPSAHTDGDIFIRFKEANVIHAGDLLFSGRFPFIDIDNGGSVQGYIEGLKMILNLTTQETKIIAGHGPTSSIQDIKNSLNMLKKSQKIIYELVQQGLSLKEIIARNPLKEFTTEWSWAFISTDFMVQTHYYDLTGKLE